MKSPVRIRPRFTSWDMAIAEAERQLNLALQLVARLEELIELLEARRRAGEPWPE
jgi:hypothetical protein